MHSSTSDGKRPSKSMSRGLTFLHAGRKCKNQARNVKKRKTSCFYSGRTFYLTDPGVIVTFVNARAAFEPRSAFVSHPGSQRYPNTKAPRRGIKTKITSASEQHPAPPCWGALATERHVRSDASRRQSSSRCLCGR